MNSLIKSSPRREKSLTGSGRLRRPVCTEVLEQFGLKPDIEPTHPQMRSLVAEIAGSAHEILAKKGVR